MNDKKFANIDELCADIDRNYLGSQVGNIYDGKYRVTSVGSGTVESILERLMTRKKTKLVYLILEDNDG